MIAVGDKVTESLQELGRTPDVQVIDETEGRVRRLPPEVPYVRILRAKNPAGTITREATEAVRGAFAGAKPVRVLIEGEEDLLAIPAIDAAPEGSVLYYGQPGKGVVRVSVDGRAKSSVRRSLSLMRTS